MSVQRDLDALIDWYETSAPDSGRVIAVTATRNTVRKFARSKRGGPLMYRDREIVPQKKSRKERPLPPAQQEMQTE